jgi:hypothetical protein
MDATPVLNGGLPQATTSIGELFYYDARPLMTGNDADGLTFTAVGMATDTSLRMSSSGVLSGVISEVDVHASPLLITATDRFGNKVQATMAIEVKSSRPVEAVEVVEELDDFFLTSNRSPVSTPIKRRVATEGSPFIMGVSSSFLDQDNDLLTFSLDGLLTGSGLKFDAASGILSGISSAIDATQMQPLHLTVTASDGKGGLAAESFLLTVFLGDTADNTALTIDLEQTRSFSSSPA